MTTLAIGVDLGGTNLRIAAVDSNGKVLEKITTSTQVARGRDQVIDEMCVAIQEVVGKQRNAANSRESALAFRELLKCRPACCASRQTFPAGTIILCAMRFNAA